MANERAKSNTSALWVFASILLVGSAMTQGCKGYFGGADDSRTNQPSDGSSGTSGVAGASGPCALSPAPVQRLTKLEYNNVIRDLFGLNKDYSATFSEDAEGLAGFTTEAEAQNLSLSVVNDYWNVAKLVANDVFAANPNPLLTCISGDACAKTIITSLATKAFRQPPPDDEITSLMALYKASSSPVFTDALKVVVRAILVSPRFLFRVYELPPSSAESTPLTDHELASRLSFFMWGSIPDDPLLTDASQGRLQQTEVLTSHVRRMIADPRISYLSRGFGYQWLKLNRFELTNLDTTRFPTWNDSLKASMKNETLAFVDNVFAQDQSVMDFVSAKYSFLDRNMSEHYGIGGATGSVPTKVPLDDHRVGVLTHASILALTSVANRTAPVRRGKWLLEQILCSGVGAPPANVPPLPPSPNGDLQDESMIRQRLSQHTEQGSSCKACHGTLDPIGFAYENYDAAGIYRTAYSNGAPVDASGQLPTGETFANFMELEDILRSDNRFAQCFTKRFASFAEGRDMTANAELCTTAAIAESSVSQPKRFSDLVLRLVTDPTFRSRKVNY
ncbi:hypothetical protein AKJ09_08190 [Labilithrix luteola]|uniref:Cellulose-binding domain protein n=1 Tax=Labilithrix luteola TaxID=1391654 RepID=A0A0K1Q791_9BACT|nr:DUF1592 domain-containing protein [Labilithrix luteola]AKV01527.1 hypothetical protein AKJ09_08190 [Labilithrix luteola]